MAVRTGAGLMCLLVEREAKRPSAECSAPRQLVRCGLRGIGFMSPGSLSKIEPGHLPSSGSYMKGGSTGLVLFSVKVLLEDQ